jgi:hypothetical protein
MTYRLATTIYRYVGTSLDSKPTSGVTVGSTFQEFDTGDNYVFTSHSAWALDKTATLSVGEYRNGVNELRLLLEGIYLEIQAANLANGVKVN